MVSSIWYGLDSVPTLRGYDIANLGALRMAWGMGGTAWFSAKAPSYSHLDFILRLSRRHSAVVPQHRAQPSRYQGRGTLLATIDCRPDPPGKVRKYIHIAINSPAVSSFFE